MINAIYLVFRKIFGYVPCQILRTGKVNTEGFFKQYFYILLGQALSNYPVYCFFAPFSRHGEMKQEFGAGTEGLLRRTDALWKRNIFGTRSSNKFEFLRQQLVFFHILNRGK